MPEENALSISRENREPIKGLHVSASRWITYARERRVPWAYVTYDNTPRGYVTFKPEQKPSVRATLVSSGIVALVGITSEGRQIVNDLATNGSI